MSCEKLKILLWKNWVLQKRRRFSTVSQIALPVLIVMVAAWMKSAFQENSKAFENISDVDIKMPNLTMCVENLTKIVYSPKSDQNYELMREAFEKYGFKIESSGNSTFMYNQMLKEDSHSLYINLLTNQTNQKTVSTTYYSIKSNKNDSMCELMGQHELESGFIRTHSKSTILHPITSLRNFPYKDPFSHVFTVVMALTLPVTMVLSMFSVVASIVKGMSSERQSGMKDLMKIMGLPSIIHWLSWFIKSIIMTTIIHTIVTVFVCVPIFGKFSIFDYSNFFIIWIFLLIYCIGVITFSFMVSTFFRKASSAANIGIMCFFTTYVPFYVLGSYFEDMRYFVKVLFLLPLNTAFGEGITMALNMDLNQKGISFSNLFSHYEGFNFSFGEVMIVMLISSLIHVSLTYYVESVFPGDVGVPKPWNFPIVNFIRLVTRRTSELPYFVSNENKNYEASDNFEEEPIHLNVKVRIVNLTKKFGSFIAVNNLNLNIYEDQITVLLGHNGGGKTTTMSIMTGMFPPTHGTVIINGFDIRTETEDARKSLGICPQRNVLFNDLTVEEHIIFFCRLKGMRNMDEIKMEIEKYLKLMNFEDKRNKKSKTLSGGQKRKLSIANALCANSQFVVLDEPTSGLDVSARRNLWDLLISEKKGRTVLLTTHYMDEAEVLGDRIAIMSEGVLKTAGTSFFLKKKFGSGYRLIVVKAPNCDSMNILEIINSYDPGAAIESEEQMEVTFSISEELVDKFENLFSNLESNSEELGIESLGCSLATLEDVFLKIGEDRRQARRTTIIEFRDLIALKTVSAQKLWFNQILAFILKKIHFTKRSYVQLLIFTILTIWFQCVFLGTPFQQPGSIEFQPKLSGIVSNIDEDVNLDIIKSYKSLFDGLLVKIINRDIPEYIFGSFLARNQKYQIGITYGKTHDTVWFNHRSFKTGVDKVSLNYYHRALLKNASSLFDIQRLSNSFNRNFEMEFGTTNQFEEILIYLLFFLLLMFWPSLHVTLKIKERVSRSKLIQFISGANRFLFTFTSFLLDSLITIAILFIVVGTVAVTEREGFDSFEKVSVHLLSITFFVMNVVPLIYIMSFWFQKHTTGETVVSLFPIAFAVFYVIYVILDQTYSDDGFPHFLKSIIFGVGLFLGPFSLINVYNKIQSILFYKEGEIWSFGERGIGINIVLMSIGSAIFLMIIFLRDFHFFKWLSYKIPKKPKRSQSILSKDDDVLKEAERVRSKSKSDLSNLNLVLKGLSKNYGDLVAVNQLYLGVEAAECFGLLGVSGSGKTSVFKMLTGDETISSGDSWIRGYSVIDEISKVYSEIGYCPQYDALLDELTGRETMKIFCLLRGIPLYQVAEIIESLAIELDFLRYLDVRVGQYSGGNKRKLSTCLALLGNISLVILDEFSSGIDVRATRKLWNAIKQARKTGKSIVISSHSMQECESLCTRLAIMVDGEFQCIGSIQHIKNKFAKGFILKIMMSQRDDEELFQKINNHILKTFPTANLKESFMGLLTFHIDLPELKWSQVFAELSKMKTELGISDYTLTQSSLESVFLFFSQQGKRKVE